MENRRVSAGFRIAIFVVSLVASFFILQWVGPLSYHHTGFWEKAAKFFGDNDLEGFILMSLALINLVLAICFCWFTVRAIERRMNSTH